MDFFFFCGQLKPELIMVYIATLYIVVLCSGVCVCLTIESLYCLNLWMMFISIVVLFNNN